MKALLNLFTLLLLTSWLAACGNDASQDASENTQEAPQTPTVPTVSNRFPTVNAVGVTTDVTLSVGFSSSMRSDSINNTTFTLADSSGNVTGSVNYDGTTQTATFTPDAALSYFQTYTASLSDNIMDSDNTALAATSWSFTTRRQTPTLLSRVPAINAVNVATDTTLSVVFNNPMRADSINGTTFSLADSNGNVAGSVSYSSTNQTATFTPNAALSYFTTYSVSLSNGIMDIDNTTLAATSWEFTTAKQAPFAKIYRANWNDKIADVQLLDDDSMVAVAQRQIAPGQYRAWISRLNTDGNIAWEYTVDAASSYLYRAKNNSASDIITAGTILPDTAMLMKFSNSGTLLWQKTIANARFSSLDMASDDTFVAAGSAGGIASVVKFNADASIAWQKSYGTTEHGISTIKATSDGGYIVLGTYRLSVGANTDAWIVKLNSDGNIAWQKLYATPNSDRLGGVAVLSDGYILAGDIYDYIIPTSPVSNAWVMKINLSGSVVWQKQYNFGAYETLEDIVSLPSGDIAISGSGSYTTVTSTESYPAWLARLNSSGNSIWHTLIGGDKFGSFKTVKKARDGDLITAGYSASFTKSSYLDAYLFKIASDGTTSLNEASGISITSPTVGVSNATATVTDTTIVPFDLNLVVSNSSLPINTSNMIEETPSSFSVQTGAPTNLSVAQNGTNQLRLTWSDNSNDESGYIVFRSADNVNFNRIETLGANIVEFVDTSLTTGMVYYYKVVSYNTAGYTDFSSMALGTSL